MKPEKSSNMVVEVPCKEAEELLERLAHLNAYPSNELNPDDAYIRELNPNKYRPIRGDWIFRGQSNAGWGLMPKAHRGEAILRAGGRMKYPAEIERKEFISCTVGGGVWKKVSTLDPGSGDMWHRNALFEYETLRHFFIQADKAGVHLPEDGQAFREALDELHNKVKAKTMCWWPSNKLISLSALAQHHGIPTSLIDWTRNSKIAMYFAAISAAEKIVSAKRDECGAAPGIGIPCNESELSKSRGCMAVWAFNLFHHLWIEERFREEYEDKDPNEDVGEDSKEDQRRFPLRVYSPPRATNERLYAQKGVFMCFRQKLLNTKWRAMSFDKLWKLYIDNMDSKHRMTQDALRRSKFIKYTLPWKESRKLLRLLHSEGVDGSKVYPGLDGVSQLTREQVYLWEDYEQECKDLKAYAKRVPSTSRSRSGTSSMKRLDGLLQRGPR